ncbi:uncharacterized protein LOC128257049 [Drosophila gunungcola]|uniref:Protein dpy-30 homolog n=1 Tax=Drosophila gunungcola TaxID=103775 RepID=A0A9P9YQT1_9MUSC|nr:uncharacterized protein LOC128257049 [Drosophila gunungcola]KAI8041470.1 hypothetical protein M5D96_005735 [Drosophila gunungcola]
MPYKGKASPRKISKTSVDKSKKNPSAIISILCPDANKSRKESNKDCKNESKPEGSDGKECPRTGSFRSSADQRIYLEQEVVPILMEGMLGLARELPRDPIGYLEKFWLNNEHKCDIKLPQNIL